MSLRDAIKEQHDAAEAHPLTALLLSGNVSEEIYAQLLFNQYLAYCAIENRISECNYPWMENVKRQNLMLSDLRELCGRCRIELIPFDSTLELVDRINSLDIKLVHAHLYVNHLADMYGGQILKNTLPGACLRYIYQDRADGIASIRSVLTDDLADEAKVAFNYAIELLNDVATKYNISSTS